MTKRGRRERKRRGTAAWTDETVLVLEFHRKADTSVNNHVATIPPATPAIATSPTLTPGSERRIETHSA